MRRAIAALLVALLAPVPALAQPNPTLDISQSTTVATGSTTPRTLADRAAYRVNVRDYGAKCDGVTDDRNAFAAAINQVNALYAATTPAVVYIPAGVCVIKGINGPLPGFAIHVPGGVLGDGSIYSTVQLDSTYVGDAFSWSEAWYDGGNNYGDTKWLMKDSWYGPMVRGISIMGDRTAAGLQFGLHVYDRVDYMTVSDLNMDYLSGGCFSVGDLKNATQGFIREPYFTNIRCDSSGSTGSPAFRIDATAQGANPIKVENLDITGPRGVGLKIAQNTTAGGFGQFTFVKLRIEGAYQNPYSAQGDLLQIGDTNYTTSGVTGVYFHGLVLVAPYTGFCAMRLTAANGTTKPQRITVYDGTIEQASGSGKGLCLDAGTNNVFHWTNLTSVGTNVTIGSSALVGTNNLIDGNGREQWWTWSVDPSVQQLYTTSYLLKTGDPVDGKMSISANMSDNTANGGNQRGPSTVDLQMSRTAAGQVATGPASVIGGGANNTAATNATVAGGSTNTATGSYGAIPGGLQATDRARYGVFAYASGQILAQGDAQLSSTLLRRAVGTAAATQLTSSGTNANATNCMNIPDNASFGFSIRLHARDLSTAGSDYDWWMPNALMTRDTGAASVAVALGTPVILSRGVVTGIAVTATPDTTNGCLNLSFQQPSAPIHTWHVVARIEAVEVQ
jgi:hypothetical protein